MEHSAIETSVQIAEHMVQDIDKLSVALTKSDNQPKLNQIREGCNHLKTHLLDLHKVTIAQETRCRHLENINKAQEEQYELIFQLYKHKRDALDKINTDSAQNSHPQLQEKIEGILKVDQTQIDEQAQRIYAIIMEKGKDITIEDIKGCLNIKN